MVIIRNMFLTHSSRVFPGKSRILLFWGLAALWFPVNVLSVKELPQLVLHANFHGAADWNQTNIVVVTLLCRSRLDAITITAKGSGGVVIAAGNEGKHHTCAAGEQLTFPVYAEFTTENNRGALEITANYLYQRKKIILYQTFLYYNARFPDARVLPSVSAPVEKYIQGN